MGKADSNFVTDSGQFYDSTYATGIPQAVSSRFINSEYATNARRAKVISIDLLMLVRGETGFWVLWQGDDDISTVEYSHPDEVRNAPTMCFPLNGGVIPSSSLVKYTIRRSGLWQSSEQKIVLCVDPTVGLCEMYFSIHVSYLIPGGR